MRKQVILLLGIAALLPLVLVGCGLGESPSGKTSESSNASASAEATTCPEEGEDFAPRYLVAKKWAEAPSDYTFCKKSGAKTITVYYIANNEEYPKETIKFYLQRKIDDEWTNVADFTSTKEGQDENVYTFKSEYNGKPLQDNAEYRLYYVDEGSTDHTGTIVMSSVENR